MKTLILLKGAGKTGKSQTLIELVKRLEADGGSVSYRNYHYNGEDFSALLDYLGTKVGIITIGDPGTEDFVWDELEALYEKGCSVILASSRNYGQKEESVYEYLRRFGSEKKMATMETSTYRTYEGWEAGLSHEEINKICVNALLGAVNYIINSILKS